MPRAATFTRCPTFASFWKKTVSSASSSFWYGTFLSMLNAETERDLLGFVGEHE